VTCVASTDAIATDAEHLRNSHDLGLESANPMASIK
jgi:hypothetical protein